MEMRTILQKALEGVQASMTVIKNSQGRNLHSRDIASKEDATIVTAVDKESLHAALPYLRDTGIPLVAEDGEQNIKKATYRQFFDPLDGTSPFASGLVTSTVIWGLYDVANHELVASIVGEPASGRIWFASKGDRTKLIWYKNNTILENENIVTVDKNFFTKKSTILLDKSHGFTRSGKIIFTDEQIGKLFSLINKFSSITIPGSNGLIQAMVANGGAGVIGSISTALGGPWDVCGVLLVLQAGGHAKAFAVNEGGLEERDPLDIEGYDCLVTSNTVENLEILTECLHKACNKP